jgi:SAM-dependent methyltransferase
MYPGTRVDEAATGDRTYWELVAETRWGTYITQRQEHALVGALHSRGVGTALELGCEGGRWSALMHARGWDVICTDVDAESLARCQTRIPDARCILVEPDAEVVPVDSGSVQLLLVYEVRPVIESEWFVSEARRVLAPGGMLVCSYWNRRSIRGAVFRALSLVESARKRGRARTFDAYYRGAPYSTFRSTLRAHGFRIEREEGICWFPFRRSSNSALIPAAVATERLLGLRRLPTVSPWVLCVGRVGL